MKVPVEGSLDPTLVQLDWLQVEHICLENPMDCSPPGPSVHGIFQARVQEWGATREESGVLGFPSRRGLTPRGGLECNPAENLYNVIISLHWLSCLDPLHDLLQLLCQLFPLHFYVMKTASFLKPHEPTSTSCKLFFCSFLPSLSLHRIVQH